MDQTIDITCSVMDAGSGVASSTCPGAHGEAWSFGVGTHSLVATATDVAGNTASLTTTFTVTASTESVCALVTVETKTGVAHSLCVKLQHGSRGAFENEVRAQSGKSISVEHAATLIELVAALP